MFVLTPNALESPNALEMLLGPGAHMFKMNTEFAVNVNTQILV